jgi:uncharacterized protein (DUF2252 family)
MHDDPRSIVPRTGKSAGAGESQRRLLPAAERRLAGRDLRARAPRSLQAQWNPPTDRRDPVELLIETGRHRIPSLLPLRYDRMRQSPFAFFRGAAAVMAADLASTPACGLRVQAVGDAHHANFGLFAIAGGAAAYDVCDYDETLTAPFEWDLKRLAASLAVDAKSRGMADKAARQIARAASLAYRTHVAWLAKLGPMEAWGARVEPAEALGLVEDSRQRDREARRMAAVADAQRRGFPRLLERRRGRWRLREQPGLLTPLAGRADDTHELAARTAFASYQATLAPDRRALLERYELADVALKTTGVAGVGTFCAIGLFASPEGEPLLLQIKEAQPSALGAGGERCNQGRRVVLGQRLMSSVDDCFLGWTRDPGDDRPCYARRLSDPRLATVPSEPAESSLPLQATLCGRALARAHARSGDAARISGYMGEGGVMDAAIADFAMAYAAQTERDWRLFQAAVAARTIPGRAS